LVINRHARRIGDLQDIVRARAISYEIADASGADVARVIKSDFERRGPIVQASGLTPLD
jgi:hypothetical protein